MLIPHIPVFLNVYLKLMNEIDLDELVSGLTLIVRYFNKDILLYSRELFEELYKAFVKFTIFLDSTETQEETETNIAPRGIFKTMDKLLEISANTDVHPYLENQAFGVIKWGLTHNNWETQDDIFEIMLTLVKYPDKISSGVWDFYKPLLETVLGDENEVLNFNKEFPNLTYEGFGYESLLEISKIVVPMIMK